MEFIKNQSREIKLLTALFIAALLIGVVATLITASSSESIHYERGQGDAKEGSSSCVALGSFYQAFAQSVYGDTSEPTDDERNEYIDGCEAARGG